jgi:XTP/dITP diphosphohydrolase
MIESGEHYTLIQSKRREEMQIILATSNKGKIREFREILDHEIKSFSEIIGPMEIEETGNSFSENALIKAKAVYEKSGQEYLVISDDSGITVPLLGNEPGIFSARYAGEDATDRDNLLKLVNRLKEKGIRKTPAYYTAAIAIVGAKGSFVVHGWMHGNVIDEMRGDGGFGYDPSFIPEGFDKTLGELDKSVKTEISHRTKAIKLAIPIIGLIKKRLARQSVTSARYERKNNANNITG